MAATRIWHEGVPDAAWDKEQTKRGAHFLQGSAWAAFQQARGRNVFYAASDGWSWLAFVEHSKLGSYLYCPYGPTVQSSKALQSAMTALKTCGKKLRVDFVRVEPQGPVNEKDLRALQLHRAHSDIQPRHTLIKELTRDDDALLSEMSATNRRLYRHAARDGFTFQSSHNPKDIAPFLTMMHEVAKRQHITPHRDEYFTKMAETLLPLKAATLFYALHQGQIVASCFAFENAATRYYVHAAAADSARHLRPGVPLMGYLIFDAKAAGKKYFDYYSIAPPDEPNHKWAGFTQLKKSFGGEVKSMLGTWELPVKMVRYHAYRIVRRIKP